jgi:hypothetical protein
MPQCELRFVKEAKSETLAVAQLARSSSVRGFRIRIKRSGKFRRDSLNIHASQRIPCEDMFCFLITAVSFGPTGLNSFGSLDAVFVE